MIYPLTSFSFCMINDNVIQTCYVKYLDLIEAKTTGCFDLLDEESKLPMPRSEHFTMEVHNRNKGHARLGVIKLTIWFFLKETIHMFVFSFHENLNYLHYVKFVMMKVS